MKRLFTAAAVRRRVLALALALILALTGCGAAAPKPEISYTPGTYDLVPFDEMEYRRPDLDGLEELFTATADYADAASRRDSRALSDLLERCWDAYDEFYTMETLAMLRSDIDQSDEDAAGEYEFCRESEVRVEEWLDRVLAACAASEAHVPSRLLAGYDQGEPAPYTDTMLSLMEQENSLLRDYWRAMMLDEIQLDGRTVSYSETISDPGISEADYRAANLAYYRACNASAAPIYIDLIRVRRAMAREWGYNSYEEMQYGYFARDYSPQQVRRYLDNVAEAVAGYYQDLMEQDPYGLISYDSLNPSSLLSLLQRSAASLGGTVGAAFDLMKTYRLYDVSSSLHKAPGAYTIYLDSYDAPFCFLGAYGDVEDFLDFSHEFGHFCDAYVNDNATGSLDLAETYSQAMANLALLKSRDLLSADSYRNLLLLHLLANFSVYTEQASYADFESRAYQLPDEELTVENLNALALSCAHRFGAVTPGDEETCALYWAQVTHLFDSPFYVISYCVSADAAIQIAELERSDPGKGVACYQDMLDWKEDAFLSEVERVGLESPFAPGRAASNLALADELLSGSLAGLWNAA